MILFMKVYIKSSCLICIRLFKLDETLTERLWGLTEMFPDTVRTAAEVSAQCSVSLVKKFYRYIYQDLSSHVVVAQNSSLIFDEDWEHVSAFPARHSGWVLPPSWSLCCLSCLRLKDYSWSSSSYNSRDRWVFVCVKQLLRKQRPCTWHVHLTTLSLLDPVGAQHWNVWWDAGHDASSAWQDVKLEGPMGIRDQLLGIQWGWS